MIRHLPLLAVSAIALLCNSCGCKPALKTPGLREMPSFRELPNANDAASQNGTTEESIPVVPTK